jgi:hypothetical protein
MGARRHPTAGGASSGSAGASPPASGLRNQRRLTDSWLAARPIGPGASLAGARARAAGVGATLVDCGLIVGVGVM